MYVAIPLEMSREWRDDTHTHTYTHTHIHTHKVDRTNHTILDSAYAFVAGTGLNIYILHGTMTLYRRLILSFTVKIVHNVFEWIATSEM